MKRVRTTRVECSGPLAPAGAMNVFCSHRDERVVRVQEVIPVCLDARARRAINGHENVRVSDGQFRGPWELQSDRYAKTAGHPGAN
jgi:hypothetical protein